MFLRLTARSDSTAVAAVLKMWPPPALPKDAELEKDVFHGASSQPSQPEPDADVETSVAPGPPGESHCAAAAF